MEGSRGRSISPTPWDPIDLPAQREPLVSRPCQGSSGRQRQRESPNSHARSHDSRSPDLPVKSRSATTSRTEAAAGQRSCRGGNDFVGPLFRLRSALFAKNADEEAVGVVRVREEAKLVRRGAR